MLLLAPVVFEVGTEVMLTGVPVGVVDRSPGVVSMLTPAVKLVSVEAVFLGGEVGSEEVALWSILVGLESLEMVVWSSVAKVTWVDEMESVVSGMLVEAVSMVVMSVETGTSVEVDGEVMSVTAVLISCMIVVLCLAVTKGVTLDAVFVSSVEVRLGVPVDLLMGSDDVTTSVLVSSVAVVETSPVGAWVEPIVVAARGVRELGVAEGSPVVGDEVTAVVGNSTVVPGVSVLLSGVEGPRDGTVGLELVAPAVEVSMLEASVDV